MDVSLRGFSVLTLQTLQRAALDLAHPKAADQEVHANYRTEDDSCGMLLIGFVADFTSLLESCMLRHGVQQCCVVRAMSSSFTRNRNHRRNTRAMPSLLFVREYHGR